MDFLTKTKSSRTYGDGGPVLSFSTKTGRVHVGQPVIDALDLRNHKFNVAQDGGELFLYINDESGWKPGAENNAFTNQYFTGLVAGTFGITDEKFKVEVDAANAREEQGIEIFPLVYNAPKVAEADQADIVNNDEVPVDDRDEERMELHSEGLEA